MMYLLIGIMFAGTGVGYLFRRIRLLRRMNLLILPTVCALLFVMGIAVGSNDRIVKNLPALGAQALILAVAGTVGSLLAALCIDKFFFRNRK
jgi:uncharacterized membrane protein YbjE (DUF340 family)